MPTNSRIFQIAKKKTNESDGTWYTGQPLGKNTMGVTMRRISEKAGLSQVYTNHCVHASCITKLAKGGTSDSVIMTTSGHQREECFLTYNRHSETQRKKTAAILDVDDLDDLNGVLALASPEDLTRLEQPASLPVPRLESFGLHNTVPMNFVGASFSRCPSARAAMFTRVQSMKA